MCQMSRHFGPFDRQPAPCRQGCGCATCHAPASGARSPLHLAPSSLTGWRLALVDGQTNRPPRRSERDHAQSLSISKIRGVMSQRSQHPSDFKGFAWLEAGVAAVAYARRFPCAAPVAADATRAGRVAQSLRMNPLSLSHPQPHGLGFWALNPTDTAMCPCEVNHD